MTMRHFLFTMLIGILASATASLALAQKAGDVIPNHFIVQVKSGITPDKVIKTHGLTPKAVYTSVVKGFAGFVPPGQLKALQADPDVATIIPDRVMKAIGGEVNGQGRPTKPTPTPPPPPPGQVIPAGVQRIGAAPAANSLTGLGVGVAVVDTGLDFNHQDLPVSDFRYWYPDYSTSAQDDSGHGTHVGGIIAAKDNTVDVVGVAPGATLYAVKVLNSSGSGSDSSIIAGLQWIYDNANTTVPPIRVVNMSLGRPGYLDDDLILRQYVMNLYERGIVIVVAAGNDSSVEVSRQVPATYPEVLAVASSSALKGTSQYNRYRSGIAADTASFFTTDGKFVIDPSSGIRSGIGVTISAPGEDKEDIDSAGTVWSVGILSTQLGGGTTRMSGTSMAAPHVSGVVARIFEANIIKIDTVDDPAGPTDDPALIVEAVRDLLWEHAIGRHTSGTFVDGTLPYNSPTIGYTYDGEREGIVSVAGWLTALPPSQ